ncbi:hypothetical protein BS78_07G132900 [Paspalum vaginatum]|nr:hypothetical protein BS78_07G132900 [Paspalum vaginatum]
MKAMPVAGALVPLHLLVFFFEKSKLQRTCLQAGHGRTAEHAMMHGCVELAVAVAHFPSLQILLHRQWRIHVFAEEPCKATGTGRCQLLGQTNVRRKVWHGAIMKIQIDVR